MALCGFLVFIKIDSDRFLG